MMIMVMEFCLQCPKLHMQFVPQLSLNTCNSDGVTQYHMQSNHTSVVCTMIVNVMLNGAFGTLFLCVHLA